MGWVPEHLKKKYEGGCDKCGKGKLILQYNGYGELFIICTTINCICKPLDPPVAQ